MIRRLANYLKKLRAGADAAIASETHLRFLVRHALQQEVASSAHYLDPLRLTRWGSKTYSQGSEDGMIAEIFKRIGTTSKRFLEFGIEDGLECNSALLLLEGWTGVWIEGSASLAKQAQSYFKGYPVEIAHSLVTVENADALISRLTGEVELDLLSIDIDSLDYWVWEAIRSVRPRVVVIEYNASFPPHLQKTVACDPNFVWTGTNYFGASLGALASLGEKKGYRLVGCTPEGVNAFFVREDLTANHFCSPFTAENHYEPPRYAMAGSFGHRAGMGTWVNG